MRPLALHQLGGQISQYVLGTTSMLLPLLQEMQLHRAILLCTGRALWVLGLLERMGDPKYAAGYLSRRWVTTHCPLNRI